MDVEWAYGEALIPPAKPGHRRREVDVREVVHGLLCVLSTSCQWQVVPKDLALKCTRIDKSASPEIGMQQQPVQ